MKPAIFYTLRRTGYREFDVIAVTSENNKGTHRHILYGRDRYGATNLSWRDSRGRFDTEEAAKACAEGVAEIWHRHRKILEAHDAERRRLEAVREEELEALIGRASRA